MPFLAFEDLFVQVKLEQQKRSNIICESLDEMPKLKNHQTHHRGEIEHVE